MRLFYENELSVEELTLLVTECEQLKKDYDHQKLSWSTRISNLKANAKTQSFLLNTNQAKHCEVLNTIEFVEHDNQYGDTLEVFKKYYSIGCALIEIGACDYGVLYFESALDWFSSELLTNFADVRRFELEISDSGLKEIRIIVVHPQNLWVTTGSGSFPSV